jgi:hypothetical protein
VAGARDLLERCQNLACVMGVQLHRQPGALLAIVAYDSNNNVVMNVEKPGTRYVVDIQLGPTGLSIDPHGNLVGTATFIGQVGQTTSMTFSDLFLP